MDTLEFSNQGWLQFINYMDKAVYKIQKNNNPNTVSIYLTHPKNVSKPIKMYICMQVIINGIDHALWSLTFYQTTCERFVCTEVQENFLNVLHIWCSNRALMSCVFSPCSDFYIHKSMITSWSIHLVFIAFSFMYFWTKWNTCNENLNKSS